MVFELCLADGCLQTSWVSRGGSRSRVICGTLSVLSLYVVTHRYIEIDGRFVTYIGNVGLPL